MAPSKSTTGKGTEPETPVTESGPSAGKGAQPSSGQSAGTNTGAGDPSANPFHVDPSANPTNPPANPNDPASTAGTRSSSDAPVRTAANEFPSAVAPLVMAHQTPSDPRGKMIEALLDEREGYVRMGKKREDRVAAVDESLRQLGTSFDEANRNRQDRRDRIERGEPDPNQPDPNQKMIIALAEEREGYVDKQQPDRVAAVDESLRRLGSTPERAAELRAAHLERTSQPAAERSQQQTR
jgi:hypothetical protein